MCSRRFCPENVVCLLTSAAYIQAHSRLDLIMEANTMNPDQTAPWEQSDLGSYCLQYRLHKNISDQRADD